MPPWRAPLWPLQAVALAAVLGLRAVATDPMKDQGALEPEKMLSDSVCEAVCAASDRAAGRVDLAAGELPTQFCAGSVRLEACCRCIDQGFRASGTQNAFLHVCIPTTPRTLHGQEVDFLHIVLESLEEQILAQSTSPTFAGVNVMVYNTRPGKHAAFNRSRDQWAGDPSRSPFVTFRENRRLFHDPSSFEPNNMHNPENVPGGQVRRQTFDYINMLRECAWGGPSKDHPESFLLIIEDDFLPCPYALDEIHRVLFNIAPCSDDGYSVVSFSHGMNAIAVPLRKVPLLAAFYDRKITALPPDMLVYQPWDAYGSIHYAHELFTHLGCADGCMRPALLLVCMRAQARDAEPPLLLSTHAPDFDDSPVSTRAGAPVLVAADAGRWISSFAFRNALGFRTEFSAMRQDGHACYPKNGNFVNSAINPAVLVLLPVVVLTLAVVFILSVAGQEENDIRELPTLARRRRGRRRQTAFNSQQKRTRKHESGRPCCTVQRTIAAGVVVVVVVMVVVAVVLVFPALGERRRASEIGAAAAAAVAAEPLLDVLSKPLKHLLFENGPTNLRQCPRVKKAFEWHRPVSTPLLLAQFGPGAGAGARADGAVAPPPLPFLLLQSARYDHWMALAQEELPTALSSGPDDPGPPGNHSDHHRNTKRLLRP